LSQTQQIESCLLNPADTQCNNDASVKVYLCGVKAKILGGNKINRLGSWKWVLA
jgi:hypothetical protein